MKQMHTIGGLPRSGSTVVAAVLSQNPNIYVSDTSIIGGVVNAISGVTSTSKEAISHHYNDSEYPDKVVRATRAWVDSFYGEHKGVVFDKERSWSHMGLVFEKMFPDGHQFIMVRDLPDVFASMEKAHRKNPMLVPADVVPNQTMQGRAAMACGLDGIIGSSVTGIMDLVHRDTRKVTFLPYEKLCTNPALVLKMIYKATGMDPFEHSFVDIKPTAGDLDVLYGNKYPHVIKEDILPSSIGGHKKILDDNTAGLIRGHDAFQEYNERFGYA